jgi:hypothetical protein
VRKFLLLLFPFTNLQYIGSLLVAIWACGDLLCVALVQNRGWRLSILEPVINLGRVT